MNAINQGAHVVAHDFSVFGSLNRTGLRRLGHVSRYLTSSDLITPRMFTVVVQELLV